MTTINLGEFTQGKALQHAVLAARGFGVDGSRSGGMKDIGLATRPVTVPTGAIIMRLFHDPARQFGEWWFTPYEMAQVIAHFARGSGAFDVDRAAGKGILHATLAVRHDWAGDDPEHLGLLSVIRLEQPLLAFHGEGDSNPYSRGGDQKKNRSTDAANRLQQGSSKPVQIRDSNGHLRGVRQLFLPHMWLYRRAFRVVSPLQGLSTDAALVQATKTYQNTRLVFET